MYDISDKFQRYIISSYIYLFMFITLWEISHFHVKNCFFLIKKILKKNILLLVKIKLIFFIFSNIILFFFIFFVNIFLLIKKLNSYPFNFFYKHTHTYIYRMWLKKYIWSTLCLDTKQQSKSKYLERFCDLSFFPFFTMLKLINQRLSINGVSTIRLFALSILLSVIDKRWLINFN